MAASEKTSAFIDNPELYRKVEDVIASLRPYFETDQGDIRLVGIDKEYVVRVQLLGACKTCTINNTTLKAGIEDSLKRIIPEIKSVESVD